MKDSILYYCCLAMVPAMVVIWFVVEMGLL